MKWREIDCDFTYEGTSYGAMGDVYVRTEQKDIGPEGFRAHLFAEVPVEATVDNLRVFDANGDRLTSPAADVVQCATEALEDLACQKTWEMA